MTKLNEDFKNKFKGSTAPPIYKMYTGTAMVGIAQIPKSNAIPVFSKQEAIETVKVK